MRDFVTRGRRLGAGHAFQRAGRRAAIPAKILGVADDAEAKGYDSGQLHGRLLTRGAGSGVTRADSQTVDQGERQGPRSHRMREDPSEYEVERREYRSGEVYDMSGSLEGHPASADPLPEDYEGFPQRSGRP